MFATRTGEAIAVCGRGGKRDHCGKVMMANKAVQRTEARSQSQNFWEQDKLVVFANFSPDIK